MASYSLVSSYLPICDVDLTGWRNRTTYTDPSGKTRTWEHAERPTRPKGSDIDAVGIVAILEKASGQINTTCSKVGGPSGMELLSAIEATWSIC